MANIAKYRFCRAGFQASHLGNTPPLYDVEHGRTPIIAVHVYSCTIPIKLLTIPITTTRIQLSLVRFLYVLGCFLVHTSPYTDVTDPVDYVT